MYSLLGRIVIHIEEEEKMPIRPTRITCIFVIGDVASFFLQAGGGGAQAMKSQAAAEMGNRLVLFGLGVQLAFFFFFVLLVVLFECRTFDQDIGPYQGNWKNLLKALELSCILILIRSVYRLIEFTDGYNGFIMRNEVFFYLFDTLMMFLLQLLFNVFHPGTVLVYYDDQPAVKNNRQRAKTVA